MVVRLLLQLALMRGTTLPLAKEAAQIYLDFCLVFYGGSKKECKAIVDARKDITHPHLHACYLKYEPNRYDF